MNLLQKQQVFSQLIARLIQQAASLGYQVTLGEAWRSPETARTYEIMGRGIANSLHTKRLAMDLCLFKDGKYLTDTEDYFQIGEIWKSYSTDECVTCWGGDFKPNADGNHFSISEGGYK